MAVNNIIIGFISPVFKTWFLWQKIIIFSWGENCVSLIPPMEFFVFFNFNLLVLIFYKPYFPKDETEKKPGFVLVSNFGTIFFFLYGDWNKNYFWCNSVRWLNLLNQCWVIFFLVRNIFTLPFLMCKYQEKFQLRTSNCLSNVFRLYIIHRTPEREVDSVFINTKYHGHICICTTDLV